MGGRTLYTLLGASVLGFDLTRQPGGGAVATLVAQAIGMTPDDLPALARAHPLRLPDAAEAVVADERSPMATAMGRIPGLVATGQVAEALRAVEQAPMGTLTDLLHFVRREVFDWTWLPGDPEPVQQETAARAVGVVCDAVTAAYRLAELPGGVAEQLVEPWATAHRVMPRRLLDLGPCHGDLMELLDALARLDSDGWLRLSAVGRQPRPQGSWAPAMHSATWSVHLSGRVREAAVAQLRAARVVTEAGLSGALAARGLWNLVSGAVQSTVAADLLDDATAERLRLPVLDALGLR